MKFTRIFFVFNGVALLFLLFSILTGAVSFAPAGMFPLFLLVLLMLIVFDSYFLMNRRLYHLLEREDWPALAAYLHKRVVKEGRCGGKQVRLLAHTYLVLSDAGGVLELERVVRSRKPILVMKNGLVFGVARLLGKDITGAVLFFSALLDAEVSRKRRVGAMFGRRAVETVSWIRWYYGFSLLLDRQLTRAAEQFLLLVTDSAGAARVAPLVAGLAAFLLGDSLGKALSDRNDIRLAAEAGRGQVGSALRDLAAWNRAILAGQEELHIVVLFAYLREAGEWLYGGGA